MHFRHLMRFYFRNENTLYKQQKKCDFYGDVTIAVNTIRKKFSMLRGKTKSFPAGIRSLMTTKSNC